MDIAVKGEEIFTFPGSETMTCPTLGLHGNTGDPAPLSQREYAGTTEEGEWQMWHRESDSLIVCEPCYMERFFEFPNLPFSCPIA
jgi:hypothetical protein